GGALRRLGWRGAVGDGLQHAPQQFLRRGVLCQCAAKRGVCPTRVAHDAGALVARPYVGDDPLTGGGDALIGNALQIDLARVWNHRRRGLRILLGARAALNGSRLQVECLVSAKCFPGAAAESVTRRLQPSPREVSASEPAT